MHILFDTILLWMLGNTDAYLAYRRDDAADEYSYSTSTNANPASQCTYPHSTNAGDEHYSSTDTKAKICLCIKKRSFKVVLFSCTGIVLLQEVQQSGLLH